MKPSVSHLALAGLVMPAALAHAEPGQPFSELPFEQRNAIREMVAAPPPAERSGPYSTPMYYLMYEGRTYKGDLDHDANDRVYKKRVSGEGPDYGTWTLERNRPDWQEVMVRDWAELGLNNTHLNVYPVDGELTISPQFREALVDYVELSEKYGLKIGVRLDALGGTTAWEMNPDNPDNQTDEYLEWAKEIARIFKGRTAYYVLGDELTLHKPEPRLAPEKWTPDKYLGYFKRVAGAIREVEPDAKISMFAASSGEWFNVLYLLENGYAEYGDAVAINHYDYNAAPKFFEDARKLAPDLMFLSNGVGYVSAGTAEPRYPVGDPYSRHRTEEAHANEIAKHMFAWWDLGADTAPFYISLRNWVIDGQVYPRWFGFFGFEDYVVDEYGNMTVKRYPGWYAYQTVAHTFYNRDQFAAPDFTVESSEELSMQRAYVHEVDGGAELLLMLWHNGEPKQTTLRIGTDRFQHPVRVNVLNLHDWQDVPYEVADGEVRMDLTVGREPTILRLVRREP